MTIHLDTRTGLCRLIDDGTGTERLLGLIPQTGPMALRNWEYPLISEDLWQDINLFDTFQPTILDQGRYGSCVGHATCTAFSISWLAQGEDPLEFSPTYVYGKINNGRDQGADIGQSVDALQNFGICLASTVPENIIFERNFPSYADREASRYKLIDGYRLNSPEQLASALQMGFACCDSIMVGTTFNFLNSNGVVGVDFGPGNHCICKGGMKKIQGTWYYINQNSWTSKWGINGFAYSDNRHIQAQSYWSGIALRLVSPGPNAPKFTE